MTFDEMRNLLISKGYNCISDYGVTDYLVNDIAVMIGYSYYHNKNDEIIYYLKEEQR